MYQAGFSSTLRRITPGVWVPWYPCPMSEVKTWLRSASERSRAMASGSVRASSTSSGLSSRIEAGTAWSSRSSRDATPRARSMRSTSSGVGPMWRSANFSALVVTCMLRVFEGRGNGTPGRRCLVLVPPLSPVAAPELPRPCGPLCLRGSGVLPLRRPGGGWCHPATGTLPRRSSAGLRLARDPRCAVDDDGHVGTGSTGATAARERRSASVARWVRSSAGASTVKSRPVSCR